MIEVLTVDRVYKRFGGLTALNGVSLGFIRERITSIIGPNGAGKSTLFNVLSGFLRPDAGEVVCAGQPLAGTAPWCIADSGLGRLFQDVRVFAKLTALENVMTAFRDQRGENPLTAAFAWWRTDKAETARRVEAARLLEYVGLEGKENAPAEDLSYGQQKLLALARILANDSSILLLDEPTAGVHRDMVAKINGLLKRLCRERKKTIIVIEHNMGVVREISDWVYLMDRGEIVSFGLPAEILGSEHMRDVYLGGRNNE